MGETGLMAAGTCNPRVPAADAGGGGGAGVGWGLGREGGNLAGGMREVETLSQGRPGTG